MRNKMIILLLAIIFYMPILNANECDDLCQPPDWKYVTKTYFDYAYGCNVTVQFRWDECECGPDCINRQVEILSVSYSGDNCNLVPDESKMQRAVRIIIWESSDFMDVDYPGNGYHLRIKMKSCWERTGTTFSPCESEYCCADYEVTTTNGYVELTDKVIYGGDICGVGNCVEYCDILDLPLERNIYPDIEDFCRDDCEEYGWAMLPTMKYEGTSGDCNFSVLYALRYCTYREFMIYRIDLDGDCGNVTEQTIYNTAIKYYLAQFGPQTPNERDTFKIRAFNCWKKINSGATMIPCVTSCCEKIYCLVNDDGDIKCENQYPFDNPGWCVGTCQWVCNDLSVPLNTTLPKFGVAEFDKLSENEAIIVPNPSTGEIELKIRSVEKGDFVLKIFDSRANNVLINHLHISSQIENLKFDFSDFSSGVYFYRIEKNDTILVKGSFVIMK